MRLLRTARPSQAAPPFSRPPPVSVRSGALR
jgi:hypothetical protein